MCSMNNHADLWRRAELIRAARAAALDIEAPEERRQAVEESGLLAAAFLAEVAEHFAAYQGRVGETTEDSWRLTKEIRDLLWIRDLAAEPEGERAPPVVSHPAPTEDELAAWEAEMRQPGSTMTVEEVDASLRETARSNLADVQRERDHLARAVELGEALLGDPPPAA
jgi:hypothetical protein